jgi:hypothetical protein
MEGSAGYLQQLGSALDMRAHWLESVEIPQLKDALATYQSLFEGAMAMLIRKGLLREDPYNYEQAFTDIVVPKDDPLPDFENSDEVSYRLAAFRRQLKFVSSEITLELSTLGLARLKKISALVTYINWLEFGEGSASPTTRAFARAFMKVRMGTDTMASQILKDHEVQIIKSIHQIRGLAAEMIAFHRESWKADLRRRVLSQVPLSSGESRMRKEEAVRVIRKGFSQWMAGKPWYPALAEEILEEELAEDGAARRQKILASLAVAVAKNEETAPAPDGKAILSEAARLIARPHEELATAIAILEENERMLLDSRGSGGGWLKRLLGVGGAQTAAVRTYKVQYAEPGVPAPKTETIDFPTFIPEVQKKASLFAALSSASSPAFRRLAATGEAQLAAFIDKQLNELLLIHRRLGSLNTLLQGRATQEKKTARGIKIELLTIKNCIVKANHKRHEYGGTRSASTPIKDSDAG